MSPEPESLSDALQKLAALEMTHHVKATRELKETILRRWPSSPEAQKFAPQLRVAHEKGRSSSADQRHEAAVARAQSETNDRLVRFRERHWRSAASVADAEQEAAVLTSAGTARDHAKHSRSIDQPFAALVFAQRAVALTRDFPSLAMLAACLRHVCDFEGALSAYREAWAQAPQSKQYVVRTGAAAVLADQGELDRASSLIEPVLLDRPDDAFAGNTMGRIHRLLGDLDDAAAQLSRAAELSRAGSDRGAASETRRELRKLLVQAREAGRTDLASEIEKNLN